MTLREVITTALRLKGVLGDGQRAPSAEQAVDGLAAFNAMWRSMQGKEVGQRLKRVWDAEAGDDAIAGGLYSVNVTTPEEPNNGDRIGVTGAVTVTAGSGTIEEAASKVTTGPTSWFYREDIADWVKETDLGLDDDHPFSSDMDEGLPYMLAMRLPDYGAEPTPEVVQLAGEGRARLRQLYGARRVVNAPAALLRLHANRYAC